MSRNTRNVMGGLALAGAAGALCVGGLWLHRPAAPRLQVCSGRVSLAGEAPRGGRRLSAGEALSIGSHEGGATLVDERGNSVTFSGRCAAVYLGVDSAGPVWRLDHGRVFVRPSGEGIATAGSGMSVRTELAEMSGFGTFRIFLPERASGSAGDTPRELQLSVAVGRVALAAGPGAGVREVIPPGARARFRNDPRRPVLEVASLDADEWQQLTGSRPGHCDPGLPADRVPQGVWAPRQPGRRGPSPGSRRTFGMFYSADLGGGVLPAEDDRRSEQWCYDALADRWRRLRSDERRETGSGGAADQAPPPPASAGQVSVAGAGGVHLLYGRVGEAVETWICPAGSREWSRLEPPANPPPRTGGALYFDEAAGLFVMYGGSGHGKTWDDVWVFRAPGTRPGAGPGAAGVSPGTAP